MKLKEFINNLFFSERNKRLAKKAEMEAEAASVEEELRKVRAISAKLLAESKASYVEPLCTVCGKPTRAGQSHMAALGICPDCFNDRDWARREINIKAETDAINAIARTYGCSHEAARFILKR